MNAAETEAFLPATQQFLDSITRLKPRVAAFDCDGTLWSGDAGERFFDWELRSGGVVSAALDRPMRDRHAAYKRGEVDETTMCGEMVTMHRGIEERKLMDAATRFFKQYFVTQIFPDMRELVWRLHENGCEIWAVSSSNEWIIRAAMTYFGIPEDRILAAKVELDGFTATDRLIRVPSGWDTEMLALAKHAVAVNPNPDLEATAKERGWQVYFPEGTRTLD